MLDLASDADPEQVRRYVREIATDLSELERRASSPPDDGYAEALWLH